MRKVMFLSLAFLLSVLPRLATAHQVGDTVIVTQPTELKVGDEVMQTLPAGQGLQVLKVNGDWLWVSREAAAGWIHSQFVTPASQAIDSYTEQIRLNPRDPQAYAARGRVWEAKGELDIAILDYSQAIGINPRAADALSSRGNVWTRKGEYDKAIADYEEMIDGNLSVADAYNSRATALYLRREYDRALADYNEAIQHDPKLASAWYNRGNTRYQRGEFQQAIADCNEAIRLNPKFSSAYLALAGLYANCPDSTFRNLKKAVENAAKACELAGWNDAPRLGLLAAIFDATGDFDEAVKWQSKAVQSAEARLKSAYQARLDLYKSRKRK